MAAKQNGYETSAAKALITKFEAVYFRTKLRNDP